ncbi:hypothetical protein Ahia01_000734400, partial [Argonauta hians]
NFLLSQLPYLTKDPPPPKDPPASNTFIDVLLKTQPNHNTNSNPNPNLNHNPNHNPNPNPNPNYNTKPSETLTKHEN